MQRLSVTEFHASTNPSEVVRVDIEAHHKYSIVVEHLSSQNVIVVDLVGPDKFDRYRVAEFEYYD